MYYIIIIFALVFLFAYIKIRFPFWNMQPVFHSYDFWRYWSRIPFIIQHGNALKTKYTTPKTVKTIPFLDITEKQLSQFVDLLQCHYIPSDQVLTMIDTQTIRHYLTGHNHPAYISFFQEDHFDLVINRDPSAVSILDILNNPTPVGCISSRPVRLFMWDTSDIIHDKMAYYFDHVCVHRDSQKKHLSRNLIQTHEYVQRIKNPDIPISLFKKEQILCEGIVPLVQFKIFTFYLRDVGIPPLPKHFTVVRIFKENMDILSDFLYGLSHPLPVNGPINNDKTDSKNNGQSSHPSLFSLCAFPEIGALNALIKNHLWYVYALRRGDHIYGLYFFKDAKTTYEDIEHGNLLECVACISNMNGGSNGLFFAGFLHSLRGIIDNHAKLEISKKMEKQQISQYRMISFTDLAHNGQILDKWRWKYSHVFENPAAYYIYNMVVPRMPIEKHRCLILL